MIEICTMTSAFGNKREGGRYSYDEAIRRCRAAGFAVQDLSMCAMSRRDDPLCGEDWERHLEKILAAKEQCGVTFYQTHPPFRKGSILVDEDAQREEQYWKMTFRSLEITARIGAKWAVIHPANDPTNNDEKKQIERNRRLYDKVVDRAAALGIGVVFENMVEPHGKAHRYFSLPEEVAALCDDYQSENVKICWDFGHGNTAVPDRHEAALRMLGSRIVCVHVDDNLGVNDDHFLPFCGNVAWERLMPVLREIGFPGVLDLELAYTDRFPDDLKDGAVRHTAEVCRKLQALTIQ